MLLKNVCLAETGLVVCVRDASLSLEQVIAFSEEAPPSLRFTAFQHLDAIYVVFPTGASKPAAWHLLSKIFN